MIFSHYDILLHDGDYKKDVLVIHFWPQAADLEAEAETEMRLKD